MGVSTSSRKPISDSVSPIPIEFLRKNLCCLIRFKISSFLFFAGSKRTLPVYLPFESISKIV
jgi:hypothetical protein